MDVIELFKSMLERKSETPDDGGALAWISEYLEGYTSLVINREEVQNLFIYKKFSEGPHLCFAGHVDVVPAGEGWDTDPYTAVEKDGYIYGRGAQDMKSGLSAFIQAVHDTKEFEGTLSLLLTSDEEGPAKNGTVKVLELLKERGLIPNPCLVAEPTCETLFGGAIKIGRPRFYQGCPRKDRKRGQALYPEKATNPTRQGARVGAPRGGASRGQGRRFFSPRSGWSPRKSPTGGEQTRGPPPRGKKTV